MITTWHGIPTDIADTNTFIGFDIFQTSRCAWIQYQGEGNLILLKTWANKFGANIPVAQDMQVADAVSDDGTKS